MAHQTFPSVAEERSESADPTQSMVGVGARVTGIHARNDCRRRLNRFVFPDSDDNPPGQLQRAGLLAVPHSVPQQLG